MGRKTNPNILRIGNILHNWDAKWFSDSPKDFRDKLIQDIRIRNYVKKALRTASISRIEFVRQARETVLTIHTSRPAVVIGRGGSGIEKIQKDLQKMFGKTTKFRINVQEIRNPDTDASAVATQVVDQLERRMPYRRILKQSVSRSMQAGARGVRISIAGRLNGSDIARREWLADGSVPLHTFRADISYAERTAFTTFGAIGIKVWINRGEYELEKEEKPGETIGAPKEAKAAPRRRTSLAEKVKK
jgi:small subunit ribosomal protein S3